MSMKTNRKAELRAKRKQMVKAGAYDGRYRSRCVQDKKKQSNKDQCRDFRH